jgi:hypothetical protein
MSKEQGFQVNLYHLKITLLYFHGTTEIEPISHSNFDIRNETILVYLKLFVCH